VVNNSIDIISENIAILFDLDFTLIDSSPLVELRQKQHATYQMIPQIQPDGGINELLQALSARQILIAIDKSSRKP
jgi:FMN phosphatase YigB (HAD superfamily)